MHYFWPTAALNGTALGTANPLFSTAASRLPVWGSTPVERRQPVRSEGAELRRRPDRAPPRLRRRLRARDRRDLVAAESRPASAAGSSTSCGRSSASRSRRTPRTARARRATDNVGVQYGLKALQAGQITPEQFVDLNSKVGGIDIDGNFTPERKAADPAALEIMYSTGRMNDGSGVANLPEIDDRTGAQMDDTGLPPGDGVVRLPGPARQDERPARHRGPAALARPGVSGFPTQFNLMRQWLDTLAGRHERRPAERQGAAGEAGRPRGRLLRHAGLPGRRLHLRRHLAVLRQRRGRSPAGRSRAT